MPKQSFQLVWSHHAGKKVAIASILLASLLTVARAQRTPTSAVPVDPFPDEHRPPSMSDLDRIDRANPKIRPPDTHSNTADETCFLPPLTLLSGPSISATQLLIPTGAKVEYQKACASLRKKKTAEAKKHLERAVSDAPKYAAAWVTLGQVLDTQRGADEGRRACLQGAIVDTTYVPAYLCLADIAARERGWDEVLKLTTRAIELDPANNSVAYEYRAAALLNLHELGAAEQSALRAIELDTRHFDTRAHFVLAQVYEAKRDPASEVVQLREFLKYAKDSADIAFVKQALSQLETQAGSGGDSQPLKGGVEARLPAPRWAPADIDEWIPPVLTSAASCPLSRILEQTRNRTEDLIDNLQRFSATERIEVTDVDKNGRRRVSSVSKANYVAEIARTSSGYLTVEVYRAGADDRNASVLDSGIAAFALIFHSTHIGNFEFRCEGLAELRGSSVWQLRFEESADPNKAFTAIKLGRLVFLPRFKGRAWIAASSGEVLRIETDLSSPIPQIDLQLEHMVIDYAPVEFPTHQVRLWLPRNTDVYLAYRGHHYERTHTFSDFQLFSVDSSETIRNKLASDLPWR
jgi:tetratricopeptide (TPR) repeat protein